eukprot:gene6513-3149_t
MFISPSTPPSSPFPTTPARLSRPVPSHDSTASAGSSENGSPSRLNHAHSLEEAIGLHKLEEARVAAHSSSPTLAAIIESKREEERASVEKEEQLKQQKSLQTEHEVKHGFWEASAQSSAGPEVMEPEGKVLPVAFTSQLHLTGQRSIGTSLFPDLPPFDSDNTSASNLNKPDQASQASARLSTADRINADTNPPSKSPIVPPFDSADPSASDLNKPDQASQASARLSTADIISADTNPLPNPQLSAAPFVSDDTSASDLNKPDQATPFVSDDTSASDLNKPDQASQRQAVNCRHNQQTSARLLTADIISADTNPPPNPQLSAAPFVSDDTSASDLNKPDQASQRQAVNCRHNQQASARLSTADIISADTNPPPNPQLSAAPFVSDDTSASDLNKPDQHQLPPQHPPPAPAPTPAPAIRVGPTDASAHAELILAMAGLAAAKARAAAAAASAAAAQNPPKPGLAAAKARAASAAAAQAAAEAAEAAAQAAEAAAHLAAITFGMSKAKPQGTVSRVGVETLRAAASLSCDHPQTFSKATCFHSTLKPVGKAIEKILEIDLATPKMKLASTRSSLSAMFNISLDRTIVSSHHRRSPISGIIPLSISSLEKRKREFGKPFEEAPTGNQEVERILLEECMQGKIMEQLLELPGTCTPNMGVAAPLVEYLRARVKIYFGQKLGAGGFGTVYKGTMDGKEFAFKLGPAMTLPEMCTDLNGPREIVNHIFLGDVALMCKGWYVRPIPGSDELFQTVMVVDLKHTTLHDFFMTRRGELGMNTFILLLIDLIARVEAIHLKGVHHNDIKAENILLTMVDMGCFIDTGAGQLHTMIDDKFYVLDIGDLGLCTHKSMSHVNPGGTPSCMGYRDLEFPSGERDVWSIGAMATYLLMVAPCLQHLITTDYRCSELSNVFNVATHSFSSQRPTTSQLIMNLVAITLKPEPIVLPAQGGQQFFPCMVGPDEMLLVHGGQHDDIAGMEVGLDHCAGLADAYAMLQAQGRQQDIAGIDVGAFLAQVGLDDNSGLADAYAMLQAQGRQQDIAGIDVGAFPAQVGLDHNAGLVDAYAMLQAQGGQQLFPVVAEIPNLLAQVEQQGIAGMDLEALLAFKNPYTEKAGVAELLAAAAVAESPAVAPVLAPLTPATPATCERLVSGPQVDLIEGTEETRTPATPATCERLASGPLVDLIGGTEEARTPVIMQTVTPLEASAASMAVKSGTQGARRMLRYLSDDGAIGEGNDALSSIFEAGEAPKIHSMSRPAPDFQGHSSPTLATPIMPSTSRPCLCQPVGTCIFQDSSFPFILIPYLTLIHGASRPRPARCHGLVGDRQTSWALFHLAFDNL